MRCYYHQTKNAVANCQNCGKGLCGDCAERVRIPLCQDCISTYASYVKKEMAKTIFLGAVLGIAGTLIAKTPFALILAWVPFGWKALSKLTPKVFLIMPGIGWAIYFFIKFLLSYFIGWVALPVMLYKWIREIKAAENVNMESEEEDIERMKQKAMKGDAEAAFEVGHYYDQREEYAESVKWLMFASEHGNSLAKVYLAGDYVGGYGVEKNIDMAIKLANELREAGVASGTRVLGQICTGFGAQGLPWDSPYYDLRKAEAYFLEVFYQADAQSAAWELVLFDLGSLYGMPYMYNDGKARTKDEEEICDPVKALHFWYLAHLNGENIAVHNIEQISKSAGIIITEKQRAEWEAEYRNKCS